MAMELEAKTETSVASVWNDPESGRRKRFASVIIFDLESTGLRNRPKITELCMLSVQTDELKSGAYPRVVNKLQLCFNPQKSISIEASQMTGLFNDALEQMALFKDQASVIGSFLASQPQPVCIIAHNGLYFDFPLLQAELCKANHILSDGLEIWCADSLHALRVLDGLPAVPELYKKQKEKNQDDAADNENDSEKCDDTSKRSCNPSTSGDSGWGDDHTGKRESTTTKRAVDYGEELAGGSKLAKKDSSETTCSMDPRTDEPVADHPFYRRRRGKLFAKRERLAQRLSCSNKGEGAAVEDTNVTSVTREDSSVGALSSQGSVSDLEISAAYDAVMAETQAGLTDMDKVSALQKQHETTPTKKIQTAETAENIAAQFVTKKEEPPASIPAKDRFTSKRSRMAKRLFGGSKSGDSSEGKQFLLPPAQYKSYKLSEIYKRDYGCYPEVCHAAEDDCITLLKVIVKRQEKFMSYIEDNAVLLRSVEPMYNGSPAPSNNNNGSD